MTVREPVSLRVGGKLFQTSGTERDDDNDDDDYTAFSFYFPQTPQVGLRPQVGTAGDKWPAAQSTVSTSNH